ncbi:hypothetical protein [Roseateles sp. P5_E1]
MTARFAVLLLAANFWGMVGVAQAEELPRSAACRTALNALNEAEEAIAAAAAASSARLSDQQRQHSVAARLQPLRKRVADACLGGLTTSPPPSQHSWVVPTAPARPGVVAPRVPMPALPPVALPRPEVPVTVTQCNAATCLASDGSTLTRVGPTLVGPRGSCTVQGVFLRCP